MTKNNKVYTTLWASNHSEWDREKNDYYATDCNTLIPIIDNSSIDIDHNIREPACWEWHLSKFLEWVGFNVLSSDLINRWYWKGWVDFLKCNKKWRWDILTNPPYKYAQEFVEKWLSLVNNWNLVIMFLKLQFLEWQKRKEMFIKWWLRNVLVFSKRQMCAKNWEFEKYKSNAIAYWWFVWEKWYSWKPTIDWI